MYCYIYDESTQDKRFEKEVMAIENRLTDLGIAGKILRRALFRNIQEMVRDEIRRGTGTLVAVGGDDILRSVIDTAIGSQVTVATIPLGSPTTLAEVFGVPSGLAACDVLSARIVETIDIGTVNGRRFVTGLSIPEFRAELTCEGQYRLFPTTVGALEVRNLGGGEDGDTLADPTDGQLEAIIRVQVKNGWGPFARAHTAQTCLPFTSIAIRSEEPIALLADGEEMTGTRFDIGIEPMVLKVVTGRARKFATRLSSDRAGNF